MLEGHAPIVSLLQEGSVRVEGNVVLEEEHQDAFTKDATGKTVLAITSGTIELRDNKVIVLAD